MIVSIDPVLSLSYETISAELARPVGNARASWSSRRAVIVTLEDASGARGRGEAAPLPGLSVESLEDVVLALDALGASVVATELELGSMPPSLRFALESALLELRAGERPLHAALLDDAALVRVPEQIELQVLLDDLETAEAHARDAYVRGARTFKVKIGRAGRAADEGSLLEALRALGRDVVLRADANGALEDANSLARSLARARVEYVEDPGPLESTRWVGVPLAIDAPLASDPLALLARAVSLGASFVVLKPSLFGLDATVGLAARARARGLKVVLSHALEGPIGLAALSQLALAIAASRPRALWGAQGLAPWRGIDAFTRAGDRTPLGLPYYLGEARLLRPSTPGLGL